jgi:hypothetical protein
MVSPKHFDLALTSAELMGTVTIAAGFALPYLEVGQVHRSAYGLIRSARNLDVLTGPLRTTLGLVVLCTPMLVGAFVMCVGLGWNRTKRALTGAVGVMGGAGGVISLYVSSSVSIGPIVTLSSSVLLAETALIRWFSSRSVKASKTTQRTERSMAWIHGNNGPNQDPKT